MEQKEIRFIDSGYNELFRIPDGSTIHIISPDGHKVTRTCKYIDDYHFYLDTNCLHICQFAELMEQNGKTYEPTEETLKTMNLALVNENYSKVDRDKFFKTDSGFTEVYYNPDSTAGGQLVYIEISEDVIKDAAAQCKTSKDFFSHIEGMGRGYLIDVGTPEFKGNLESFMTRKADFEGESKRTMHGLMKAVGIKPPNKDMER